MHLLDQRTLGGVIPGLLALLVIVKRYVSYSRPVQPLVSFVY
jgi:hypothetical protein